MAGLNLGIGAQARAQAQARYGSNPAPTTASEAAYGSAPDVASSRGALAPSHPAGVALWVGLGGAAFLIALYWSLPGK